MIYRKYIKRLLDITLSTAALILLSPIIGITALRVRTKLGAPVIFKQKRPGKDEKIFTLYKFRTMTDERDAKNFLLPDQIRLTHFGEKLRRTSLDELPELFNILRGDMSIVGPRPLLIKYLPLYSETEKHRHDVRPGLTGLAAVNGRNNQSWSSKFKHDLDYIQKISFLLDVKIILLTIQVVKQKKDIHQDGNATCQAFKDSEVQND